MAIVAGFDLHRRQITYDALNVTTDGAETRHRRSPAASTAFRARWPQAPRPPSTRRTRTRDPDNLPLQANSSQPTATDFKGSLLEPGAHGSATLAFTAADPDGPGVYKVTVVIDDKTFYNDTPNTNAGKCVPVATDPTSGALMFDSQQPCPPSEPVNVDLAISRLADGPHALRVSVMDGAQNTSTVLAQTITTNNRTTVSANLTGDRRANADGAPLYAITLDAPTQAVLS